jgi:hypothetical protein
MAILRLLVVVFHLLLLVIDEIEMIKLEYYRTFFQYLRSFIFLAGIGTLIGSNVIEYAIVRVYY